LRIVPGRAYGSRCRNSSASLQDFRGKAPAQAAFALSPPLHATFDSWFNIVERFFAKITRKRISAASSRASMNWSKPSDHFDTYNGQPKPYVWTKTATEIFSKVARAKQVVIGSTRIHYQIARLKAKMFGR
jgi:hypothetical protein